MAPQLTSSYIQEYTLYAKASQICDIHILSFSLSAGQLDSLM